MQVFFGYLNDLKWPTDHIFIVGYNLDQFHFRWSENSVIEIEIATSIPLMSNHLNLNPSQLKTSNFIGIIMVIVSTILYVDMLRFANSFSAQLNDFIILVINWIFCIFVFIINLAIAIYGFVCGCCYSKEFEKIIQNEQPKSAFSFTTSNKVLFSLVTPDTKVG